MILQNRQPLSTPLAGRMRVPVGCTATASIRNDSGMVEIPPVPEALRTFVF